MHPTQIYLFNLIPLFYEKKSEKYILSKLIYFEPEIPSDYFSLFCKNCLEMYIPTVNCKINLNDKINIFCMGCKSSSEYPFNLHDNTDDFDFEDLLL